MLLAPTIVVGMGAVGALGLMGVLFMFYSLHPIFCPLFNAPCSIFCILYPIFCVLDSTFDIWVNVNITQFWRLYIPVRYCSAETLLFGPFSTESCPP